MDYFILATGIALLVICGDLLVRGAVALAVQLSIPTLVIGLTIVAFGTSAPEMVVSVNAAVVGAPGIAIGNVVGSNIANVLLVLGLPALISATNCNQPMLRRNALYVIGASLIFIALCFGAPLGFWHGALLFGLLLVFLFESARRAMTNGSASVDGETQELVEESCSLRNRPLFVALLLLGGIIGLPIAAQLTVMSAVNIAKTFHVSEATIGLTIVAFGTSLPELATTVAAAFRRQCGLALGNVLGSNLFNILAIMGVTTMVAPISVPEQFLRVDLWVMLAATLAIMPFIFGRWRITRLPALGLVLGYVIYIGIVLSPRAFESGPSAKPLSGEPIAAHVK